MRIFALSILSVFIWVASAAEAQILHLELGAANYEADAGDHPTRFLVLEQTVTDLIQKYGNSGTIYLSDAHEDGLELAGKHLEKWLQTQGQSQIKVILLPGNYLDMELPHVKTTHLTNPDADQLPTHDIQEINDYIIKNLQKIAENSETGLLITTYFTEKPFDHIWTLPDFLGEGYELKEVKSSGYIYHFPTGQTLDDLKSEGNRMAMDFVSSESRSFVLKKISKACQEALMAP